MEYSGLIQKYKVNRPLTEEERELQLKQKQKLDVVPHYHFSVIKLNSVYMEAVDKYFEWKGFLTLGIIPCIFGAFFAIYIALMVLFVDSTQEVGEKQSEAILVGLFMLAIALPLVVGTIWVLRKEAFHLTHFPIRLNRKTRMLHIFRPDRSGTILSVPWDEVFFTLGRGQVLSNWDIRGHVLEADKVTVKESFALGGMPYPDKDELRRHWEFMRRYMEQGPQAVMDLIPMYLPIATRRESWLFGLQRLLLIFAGRLGAQLIMLPFFLLTTLGRVIANRTSRIPQWPAEIEATSQIEPGDPFERDERNNTANRIGWLI